MQTDEQYFNGLIELAASGNTTRSFEAMLYALLVLDEQLFNGSLLPAGIVKSAPDYTTSVDAALKLVPHGLAPHMGLNPHHVETPEGWRCWLRCHGQSGEIYDVGTASGPTLAIPLSAQC